MMLRQSLPLLCLCLAAQGEDTKRLKATLALTDHARFLPPEFCADVLLKLARSRAIPDAKWKRELIEEAFTVGVHAPLPYSRRVDGGAVESRWTQEYWNNGLEALTLQTRAVEAMLDLDPQSAAAMFSDIAFPELTTEKCEEPAVANIDQYYDVAAKVFARGFTSKQRQKEEDLQFLEQRIARMQAPAQVPAVLRMIFAVKAGEEARKRLLTAYAVALDRVKGGDRSYGVYESRVVPMYSPEIADTSTLLTAIRGYIVRQVSGPRCSDHAKTAATPGSLGGPAAPPSASVARFNALAAKVDPGSGWLKPITDEEARPGKSEGTYLPQRPYASKRAWDALMAMKWLDHGDTNPPVKWTLEQRKGQEWNAHFNDTLKLIEGWKAEEENSSEEYLINVSHTYAELAAMAPAGTGKENVMGRYLNFIETRYAETANRNLWFAQVAAMMDRVRSSEEDWAWAWEHFERSANPIIGLYAKIEKMLGPAPR